MEPRSKSLKLLRWSRNRWACRTFITLVCAGWIASCSPEINNHGHRIDPETLGLIRPGLTNKQGVIALLGSPSSIATFDQDRWYYIAQRTENYSFYVEEITAQDVVTVDFDANGTVTSVQEHGMELAKAVDPSNDKTPTLGKELTVFEQFVGNIGRFEGGPQPQSPQ